MQKLEYFGTSLSDHGHYFWELDGKDMRRSKTYFSTIPFNPEEIKGLYINNREYTPKGTVVFFQKDGYSVLGINGSCIDNRHGTKSVFFCNEILTKEEMIERIKSVEIAVQILEKMPFDVLW